MLCQETRISGFVLTALILVVSWGILRLPGSGKTSLARKIAQISDFPFVKLITPDKLVGLTVSHKITKIKKVFEDAYKSTRSVVLIDDVERLIDFVEIGSNLKIVHSAMPEKTI